MRKVTFLILLCLITLTSYSQLSVESFTLINAETDEDILTLTDGAEINLTDLPTTLLNIRANTTGNTSRVLLEISGALTNSRSEGVAPYALYGDTAGDYYSQEFILGDYTLTATPLSGGDQGTPLSVQFSIVETTAQAPFITTWKTDNPGTSADNQITIPTNPQFDYNYNVDWGDGSSDTVVNGDITHSYTTPGTYSVLISGDFPAVYFNNQGDKEKLLSVDQWGDLSWVSMTSTFDGCSNLDIKAQDTPDLSNVSQVSNMFSDCTSLVGTEAFGNWDMSNVTDMSGMFQGASAFNRYIGGWDVSSVSTMSYLFSGAEAFNQDIGNWDVGTVESMLSMFSGADHFDQDIGSWNVSNASNMVGMFIGAISFNQDIGDWDTGKVTDMALMFFSAINFNQDISQWNTQNVTNLSNMFAGAYAFNQDIGSWDVSNVTNMLSMFANANSFDQDLGSWNIANVANMSNMFLNVSLSRDHYDGILNGWSTLPSLKNGVSFHAGNSRYCDAAARQVLIDSYQWNITDGGEKCLGTVPFVTTWKTDNPGASEDNQITIPTYPGENYNYTVDWGDGTSDTGITGDITHTYAGTGTYTVSILGDFPRIYFNNLFNGKPGDDDKIISVDQWGAIFWTSMEYAFTGCENLQVTATDTPDLSEVTRMDYMFANCTSLVGNASFNDWDLNNVQRISSIFFYATSFNANTGNWDVSNVVNMGSAFSVAEAFNQDIGNWSVSKVTSMDSMFSYATSFNQNIGNWDVSNVVYMSGMFYYAEAFDQNIGDWYLGNVIRMGGMFKGASSFNQNIGNWDVHNVTHMNAMFEEATVFNQDIGNWDVSNVFDMNGMFQHASAFNRDIGNWNVGNVTQFGPMFAGATSFNQDIGRWDVSKVTWMYEMFRGARSFDQDLGNWNVSAVTRMEDMFLDAGLSVENYDNLLRGWNDLPSLQSGVSFHAGNSQYCSGAAARQNLINTYGWAITDGGENCPGDGAFITTWKTNNPGYSEDNQITIPTYPGETYNYTVDWGDGTSDSGVNGDITHTYASPGTYQVSISGTFPQIFFNDNNGLDDIYPDREKILSIDQWGSIQWKSMNSAFIGCYNLDMLATDVPDLSQVTSLANMFNVCMSLVGNDSFREWDVSTVTNMGAMFAGTNLFNIDIGNWDVSNVRAMSAMFLSALAFNQDIGSWNVGNVTGMSSMFLNAQAFNQDLSAWDVGNVTHMSSMFQLATSFDQPLGNWNVSKVTGMTNMFSGVTLSLEHYDNLLNGWANLPSLQNGVAFHGGNSEFCQAVEARQKLIGKYGWAITDGGTECPGPGLTVTGLVLVDADTNQDIMPLTHGLLVYAGSLPTMNLNIRADTTDDTSSVSLSLTGAIGGSRTENVAPFALFGDSAGDYYAELFETGSYTMTATPYSDKNLGGTAGNALSVSFEITDSTPDCITFGVSGVELAKVTDCNQPNGYARVEVRGATGPVTYSWSHDPDLNGPEAFNLSEGSYTLTYSDVYCSKEFTFVIDTALPEVSLETFEDVQADTAPFVLTGGFPEGGIYSGIGVSDGLFDPSVGAGTYEITYSYTNATGCSNSVVQTLTVQDTSVLSVTGFILVDADTDQDIMAITNDMVIDMTSLPTANLNIRASTTEDVQSVRLELGGQETYGRTESMAPYALYGDNSGNYIGHVYTPGNYTLTVTPYSGNGLSGTQGTPGSINFTFISGGSGKGSITSGIKGYEVSLAPNSASTSVNVSLTDSSVKIKSILVHDLSGRKVGEFNAPDYLQGTDYVLPVYQFQSGIYIITTVDSQGTINQERLSVKN